MTVADYRTALVTGATAGIGRACARALAARGLAVVAAGRRRDRLDALAAESGCEPLALDMRDRDAVYAALGEREIDVLVNAAGVGRGMASFLEASPDDLDATLLTNAAGLVHATRAVVPGMRARGRGHIVNLGSVAGLYPLFTAVYGASKGAVHLFSQNLRIELLGSGIRVTELCPGRVATEFFAAAIDDPEQAGRLTGAFRLLDPEDVAAAALYAIDAPSHVHVATVELIAAEQAPGGLAVKRLAPRPASPPPPPGREPQPPRPSDSALPPDRR